MNNSEPSFSKKSFINYLKTISHHKQKRMLFMIEASLTLSTDFEYNIKFGTYPDYQNIDNDKVVQTPFYKNYFSLYYHLLNKLLFPREAEINNWARLKGEILKELQLNDDLFMHDYELFKFGTKLKALRKISKKEFAEKSGLSILKITQIEENGFLSKIPDLNKYINKGLQKELVLEIK